MKKALTTLSLIVGNVAYALAQVNINIGAAANQGQVNGGAILQLLTLAQTIVARLVPFAIGIAVLAFFFFLIKMITKGDNPDEQKKSMQGMGLSILALFLMVSIWGVIGFLGSVFGVNQGGNIPTPCIPVPGGNSC
jgi:hypothetical protein